MSNRSKKILFFGNERLATGVTTSTPTLNSLIKEGYDVRAVVSSYSRGLSRTARNLEVADVAKKHNITLYLPDKLSDIADELRKLDADVAVLVAYGKMVPQSIIDLFPSGIVNIHPSLLPNYRGPTPIESAILNGNDKTGVSLMRLVKEMDSGPVFAQSEIGLSGRETKQQLADTLLEIGCSMLIDLLPGIMNGKVVALPQDSKRATYSQLINKSSGVIDLSKTAKQLEREIRAYAGWPKSRTSLGGKDIVITKAHVSDTEELSQLSLPTTSGQLVLDRLIPAGKSEMSAKAFLSGYKLS